ncbi:MAG: dynamin family protein, partial [Planktothrix sp.]
MLISENRQNRLKSLFTHPQQKLTFELKEFFQFIDDLQSSDQLLTKSIQYIQNHLRKIAPIQYRKLEDIKNFIKTLENESLTPLETVVIDIKNCLEATDPIIKLQESSYNCSNTLQKTKEFFKLSRFRIAVVGAFNQGKSTLLNAIVGEDIQPVRVIPCTSAITVLKYGEQKRVTCCYKKRKDTKQISIEEYKEIAAMSEDAAISHLSEEFAKSDIDEIIYEHDELEICKNGVELVDSPGLNQHPDATEITKRLLKDTDAVIFVLSAIQILTQQERELLKDIRNQLNGGKGNQPVSNLFILVNFMDHLDGDNEYQQIQKSAYILETGQDAIIQDKNQIHFISAKLAFNAIQKQKNNHENSNLTDKEEKYYQNFQFFIKHLEDFLANDRGIIKLQNSIAKIQQLIEDCQGDLKQFNAQLDQEKKKYDEKESQLLKDKEKIETISQ